MPRAEANGWPGKEAFLIAMIMTLHGTTSGEAERLFTDAARWLQ
jgi:hypothetical protein